MNKIFYFLFIFSIATNASASRVKKIIDGELIVKYKSKTTSTFQKKSIESFGARRIKRIGEKGFSHVRLPKNTNLQNAIDEFKRDPNVEFVQPNYIYKISTTSPNDTYFNQQWALKNTGQTLVTTGLGGPDSTIGYGNNPGTSGSDMKLIYAWDLITDCSSVTVAVLDTGINYNHNDLNTNMWDGGVTYPNHGYNFIDTTNDPMDNHGHGTHVAGIIGAVGNNGIGTTGVCWKVKLMAVKVMDATGSGTTAAIIQGIDFAVNNGAKVINMSLGGSVFDTAESNAIANAEANGVLVVVAAGNNNANVDTAGNEMYPCNFTHSNILCVAAVTQNNSLATFSNYGTTSVDVAAPGTNIVSTWPGTHTTISDPLSSGWNFSTTSTNGWGYKTTCVSGSPPGCLVNPFNFNHSTAKYNNNTDDHTWKSFNLSGASNAILNFYLIYDTEITNDKITPMISTTLGDPTSSNTPLDSSFSGTSGGALTPLSYDISAYISATTTIGFNFTSDTSKNNLGSAIGFFNIETLKPNNITYNMISGTSMATPQIAGLAAMLFAYNPNFAYNDVINSIVGGGSTLAVLNGKTKNSKTANAINALNFINKPTGGSAIKGP